MKTAEEYINKMVGHCIGQDSKFHMDRSTLVMLVSTYAQEAVFECAKKAMIEEHIPEDEQDDYDGAKSIHSGGHIRDEHWVTVNPDSILAVTKLISG